MKKVYIIQDELNFDGGGRPKFIFSDEDMADIWCERLNNEQTIYEDEKYEVVEYLVDEITDLSIGYYRVYISKGHIIDHCSSHLVGYKNDINSNENIIKCVGDNRISIGIVAHNPEEAKDKAIKKYDEVEASGFFEQYDVLHYNLYLNRGGETK